MKWRISRRGFLIGLGATGAALALGLKVGVPAGRLALAELLDSGQGQPLSLSGSPTAWFEITAENHIRLFIPKSEMGQGVHTALAQIAAEELEVAWEQLEVVHASTTNGVDAGGTSGSNTVSSLFTPLREIAATMRQLLLTEAARQIGRSPTDLTVSNGIVSLKADPQTTLTYGQIVQAQTGEWEVPEEAPSLKPVNEFKLIGQPLQRVDLVAKLQGQAVYGYDARLPGMLYGAVARPPLLESKLLNAAPGTAADQPGVVAVVTEDDFAGVVAESRALAQAGVANLALEWELGREWQQTDIDSLITVGEGRGVVIQREGEPASYLSEDAANQITSEYRTPMAAHAHLEPQAALADVQADKTTIWVSTQFPFTVRQEVAAALGMDVEQVEVQTAYLGGGFGRKFGVDVALEAARLSRAAGKPVHVGWNRTEEMRNGYLRPPTHHQLRGVLDENGRILALEHQQASGKVAFGFVPGVMETVMGADFGAWRGARIAYNIPHRHTVAWLNDLPLRTGWWRGLGLLANTFALESFMDELAAVAGVDPLQFRLNHLPEGELGERFRRVLETAAEVADWGGSLANGRSLGIACCVDVQTVVAQVAEVSLENGRPRVHKVTAAIDPGLIINPDGVKAQTQGSIIMGLSSTLFEQITVKNGMIEASNFDLYPLLTMREAPDIEVIPLSSGEKPYGMGEPPIGPIAAAVANAVFALTGERLRQLPMKL